MSSYFPHLTIPTAITLAANLKHAARNRETVTIGGGVFGPDELKRAALLVEASAALLAALEGILIWDNGELPGDMMDAALVAVAKARGDT